MCERGEREKECVTRCLASVESGHSPKTRHFARTKRFRNWHRVMYAPAGENIYTCLRNLNWYIRTLSSPSPLPLLSLYPGFANGTAKAAYWFKALPAVQQKDELNTLPGTCLWFRLIRRRISRKFQNQNWMQCEWRQSSLNFVRIANTADARWILFRQIMYPIT